MQNYNNASRCVLSLVEAICCSHEAMLRMQLTNTCVILLLEEEKQKVEFRNCWFLVNANVHILTNYTDEQIHIIYCRGQDLSIGVLCKCKHSAIVSQLTITNGSLWDGHALKSAPSCGESGLLCNTWFLGPIWVGPQMASRSVQVFLQGSRMWHTDRHTDWPCCSHV